MVYFLFDLAIDSDYAFTVKDADVYGTGTLIRAAELGNGARKLYLVVDANNQLTESNEANNKAYRTVTVESAPAEPALLTSAPEANWDLLDFADWNNDGYKDMLLESLDLQAGGTAGELFEAVSLELPGSWQLGGIADWNSDGSKELLICGNEDTKSFIRSDVEDVITRLA